MFGFLSNITEQATTVGYNFYHGLREALYTPKRLYDLYQNVHLTPVMRQLAFYKLAAYGSLATLALLNHYFSSDSEGSTAFENESVNYQIADVLFTFTYGLAIEVIYSKLASKEEVNIIEEIDPPCGHNGIGEVVRAVKIPLYFPINRLMTTLLLNSDYILHPNLSMAISIPLKVMLMTIPVAAFEYNRLVSLKQQCPEKAFNSLKNKNGFLLGEGIVYFSFMTLTSQLHGYVPISVIHMLQQSIYHSFNLSIVNRHFDPGEDPVNLPWLNTAALTLDGVKSFLGENKEKSDIPKNLSVILFSILRLLRHVFLPLEKKWYNLPFHQAVGMYKESIENAEYKLSTVDRYGLLTLFNYMYSVSKDFNIVNENKGLEYFLNEVDHDSLVKFLEAYKLDIQKHYQVTYNGKDDVIRWLVMLDSASQNDTRWMQPLDFLDKLDQSFFKPRQADYKKGDLIKKAASQSGEPIALMLTHQKKKEAPVLFGTQVDKNKNDIHLEQQSISSLIGISNVT